MTSEPPAIKESLGQARRYWEDRAAHARTDCDRVEQTPRTQRMRFEMFVRYHALQDCSVLDIGCGAGDLFEHLQRRGLRCAYTGIDIAENMIQRARARFPTGKFIVGDSLAGLPGERFDYTIAIGIHNVKVPAAWEVLALSMWQQFEMCRIAAHLSLLTDRYEGFGKDVQAWKVEDVLGLALAITPYVVVRNNYLPNDFSVTLYRAALINTDPSLLSA